MITDIPTKHKNEQHLLVCMLSVFNINSESSETVRIVRGPVSVLSSMYVCGLSLDILFIITYKYKKI